MTLVIIAMQLIIKVKSEVDKELFNKLVVLPIDFRIILYRLPSCNMYYACCKTFYSLLKALMIEIIDSGELLTQMQQYK